MSSSPKRVTIGDLGEAQGFAAQALDLEAALGDEIFGAACGQLIQGLAQAGHIVPQAAGPFPGGRV